MVITSTNIQIQMTIRVTTDITPSNTVVNDREDIPVLLRIALSKYLSILKNILS